MINKRSLEIGMRREDLAALAAQAGQSGIAFNDLGKFIEVASNAASAWDVPAKESAQTLAEIRAQTGWTNKELETYADKVNYLGDISAAAEKDISKMWGRASSGAKAAGVSYDDSMIALTALKSVGMEEEVASRAFGQFASRLRTAKTQSKAAKSSFKELGFTPEGLESGMKTDAMRTMIKFLDALGKSKDAVKHAAAFGGKEWWDEFMRFKDALPEMIRLLDALKGGKYKGSLKQAQEITKGTTDNHIDRFKNLTSIIGDRAVRWMLPSINAQLDTAVRSFQTADETGFLAGPDGLPIAKARGQTPVPFSSANRKLFLGETAFDRMRHMGASGLDVAHSWGVNPLTGSSFYSGFGTRRGAGWSIGQGAGSVAPGLLGFGLTGASDAKALHAAPRNPAFEQLARIVAASAAVKEAPVKLEGSAEITNRVIVEPSQDFVTRVEQSITARGALRTDSGVSMAPR